MDNQCVSVPKTHDTSQSSQHFWYAIGIDGSSTLRIQNKLAVGELEDGTLVLDDSHHDNQWACLSIDPSGKLLLAATHEHYHLRINDQTKKIHTVLPGSLIQLPKNQFFISNSLFGSAQDDLIIDIIANDSSETLPEPDNTEAEITHADDRSSQNISQSTTHTSPISVSLTHRCQETSPSPDDNKKTDSKQPPTERPTQPEKQSTENSNQDGCQKNQEITTQKKHFIIGTAIIVILTIITVVAFSFLELSHTQAQSEEAQKTNSAGEESEPNPPMVSTFTPASSDIPSLDLLDESEPLPDDTKTTPANDISPLTKEQNSTAKENEDWRLIHAKKRIQATEIISPPGKNAVALLSSFLEDFPQHEQAKGLLAHCADILIEQAEKDYAQNKKFEARNTLEEVFAFDPQNSQALQLWEIWYG